MVEALDHPLLVGVRAKLDRAATHREALAKHIGDWRNANADPFGFEQNGNVVEVRCRTSLETTELGLDIGDIVNNLRSALNYTVFVLMKRHTRKERDEQSIARHERLAQFPICDSLSEFNAALNRDLEGVSGRVQKLIERLQPYHDTAHSLVASPLRMLREFSNTDKHRLVAPVSNVNANYNLQSTAPLGFPVHAIMTAGPLEADATAGKVYFLEPIPPNVKVRITGGMAVALYEGWTLLGGVPAIMDGIDAEVRGGIKRMARLLY